MRTRGFSALVGVIVLAAGCGSSSSAPKAGSPEAALQAAARAYSAALVAGDGAAAFELESKRCQKVVDAGAAKAEAAQAKANYAGATIKTISVDDLSGTRAHVSLSYGSAAPVQTKTAWLNEASAWHWDEC